jgi:hypothetical protein
MLYAGWIALCAVLFFALSGAGDPSRRRDRILSNEAGARAVAALAADPRYRGYEAVHVAFAAAGEGAPEKRWVVLCDRVPHGGLDGAVVVELDAGRGTLLRIRRPRR